MAPDRRFTTSHAPWVYAGGNSEARTVSVPPACMNGDSTEGADMADHESSLDLLGRLKLGREEYCQRLLTMLIVGGPYPRWNSRQRPSPLGLGFLRTLDEMSFGTPGAGEPTAFVDELDLPCRHESEKGGAPDYALLWERRLWLIELKTEVSSHRPVQIPTYFDLGTHHYPQSQVDVTYLTPPMPMKSVDLQPGQRFAHLTWPQVAEVVAKTWSGAGGWEQELVDGLLQALSSIGSNWSDWRQQRLAAHQSPSSGGERLPAMELRADAVTGDPVTAGLELARATARDGKQRAIELIPGSLEELQGLRLELRDAICAGADDAPTRHIRPWLWNASSSGGQALTQAGETTGYELRLSRYQSRVC